ncbi:MAG: EamA family transporter [Woeseiaceae bacterium]|nr:EamA family transporter [Woeseiaceae bacterium]
MNNITLYVITVLIWGSTWFAIEFQLGTVAPVVSVAYRYLLAAALLFAWCYFRGISLKFRAVDHGWFMLLGVLLFGLNYALAYTAQVYITSALTAIAFSTVVWMNIVNARLFFGVRSGRKVLFGAVFGCVGIFILFSPQVREASLSDSVFLGLALALGGALVASFGNMASQAAQRRKLPIVQSNAWGMVYGALFSGLFAVVSGVPFNFDWSTGYIVSLLYLAVFGSVIAFGAYLKLLGRVGAHRAGYAMILFPVVALVLSSLFEGLELDVSVIYGTLLVLVGNLFVLDTRKADDKPLERNVVGVGSR